MCSCRGPDLILGPQFFQQRLGLFQIARVEPLSEPAVNRSKQFARLLHLSLVTPEAGEALGGSDFPGFCSLLAGYGKRTLEVRLGFAASGSGELRAISPAIRWTSASNHFSFAVSMTVIA